MATELNNEIKPDEQLGVSDPLNPNQVQTPPSDPFSTLTSNEVIVQNGLIRSGNFVTNSAGWRIQASGNAEFNDGTFRGTLTASSINIPDTTTANSFHVNSDGDAWWGATTLAAGVAWVKKDGTARFNTTVTVGGASTIIIDGANGKITSGDGTSWNLNGDGTLLGFSKIAASAAALTSSVADTNENTLLTVSIPGGILSTNNAFRFKAIGTWYDGTQAGTTLTINFKYGTTIVATQAYTTGASGTTGNMFIEFTVWADGTTSSQEAWGSITVMKTVSTFSNGGTGYHLHMLHSDSAGTEDSTAAKNFVVTTQLNSATGAPPQIVIKAYTIEKIA